MADAVATQPHNLPLRISREICAGKTYIVTGANISLGLEATKHLVAAGAAKVIMAVRNISAGEAAKAGIEAATGTSGVAEVWALDLASYDSVKAFAARAVEELERIDALIENAGVAAFDRYDATRSVAAAEDEQGRDEAWDCAAYRGGVQQGWLRRGGGLESYQRRPACGGREGRSPRIQNVQSHESHPFTLFSLAITNIDDTRYPLSKLLQVMAIRRLAVLAPVSRTGVVMNLVCPGSCRTELGRYAPPAFVKMLQESKEKYGRTAEDGSRTLLYGAVAGKESHGCFLDSCRIAEDVVPAWVTDEEGMKSQKLVWDVITSELESIQPGCLKAIL
ncbi:hypothetical protein V493_01004 [Pseudogymnoascus sp. VKM F-4281 (FW-2241)]|nr:hypothetical protein V493_01004 [Pseudogymnoascus sp. VKM F-4281 (FW-2241)]